MRSGTDIGEESEDPVSGVPATESERNETGEVDEEATTEEENEEIPVLRRGDHIRATLSDSGEEKAFEILSLAGKRNSKRWGDCYNIKDRESGRKYWVNLREYGNIRRVTEEEEVLLGCDSNEITAAKEREFESWRKNQVYEEVEDEGQKALSVRWVITNKEKEGKMVCKARLVARGFEESDDVVEKEAPTCAPEAFRLCLAIMLMKGWDAQTIDVKTAYLQGEQIRRNVYVKPPTEAKTRRLWRLKKTIYGLKDAARAWYDSVTRIMEELGGKRSRLEPTLFVWRGEDLELIGVMVIHVDDFCYGGNEEFNKEIIGTLKRRLNVGEVQKRKFCYLGVGVEQEKDRIYLDQSNYIKKITVPLVQDFEGKGVLSEVGMKAYRGVIGKMNWISQHTRPDMAFEVSQGGQFFQEAKGEDMVNVLKVVQKMKRKDFKMRFQQLRGRLQWEVYTDASYGNVGEGRSQIGYMISLRDSIGSVCPIYWRSVRAKRVARSTTEAEALALTEASEMTIYLDSLMMEVVGKNRLEVLIKTDNETLEKALKSSTGVKSRRLRIDLAAIKEMVARKEIGIQWITNKQQVADVFTKIEATKRSIREYVYGKEQTEKRGEV